ncbi:MAG: PQQ-binding-like beta-propeller repeat protein [Paracoccaceae bacterium]
MTARVLSVLAFVALVAGCGLFDDEEILEGDRRPVRQAFGSDGTVAVERRPLPAPRAISDWTQTSGNATHNSGHLQGPTTLDLVWSEDAGTGTSDDSRITSPPVVTGGLVITLDAAAELRAFDAQSGAERWRLDLVPNENEDGEEGFGGGIAAEDGVLYVTTGFGEVLAIRAEAGEIVWRRSFGAPFRAAPAVDRGVVLAVTRNSQAFGIAAADGQVLWRVQGVSADAGSLGGASPAIAGNAALIPFASGELLAADLTTGRRAWGAVLTGGRRGLARAAITDLTGDPVVVGPVAIVANQSGRIAAFEGSTGRRVWTRAIGSIGPIWAAGDTIFLVSDTAELLRLDAGTGETLWQKLLPQFDDPEDREDPIAYSGPVLVSGRVIVTDSEGQIWSVDGETGEGEVAAEISGGAVTGPVVAGGTVYILSENAVLHAYR